ncbi:hypothetical protein LFL97_34135 [Burkholderia sp. JSH-S8]|nr:hypothetical protein LFL97_34135 [Burkholderia sp. JSH-S8]
MNRIEFLSITLMVAYGSAAIAQGVPQEGVRAEVLGTSFQSAICLKDLNKPGYPYVTMPPSGTGDFFAHYKSGQKYSVAIACQPKHEQCSIISGASGIAIPGTTQIRITCRPALREPVQPTGTKFSYAWSLSGNFNQQQFPLLDDLDPSNLGNRYFAPSTVPLATTSNSLWKGMGAQPSSGLRDYTLLYRTDAAINRYTNGISHASYFNNWAFIRKMISFGGSVNDGSHVIAPLPDWVSAAHRNGVKIYGTVFIGDNDAYQGLTDKLIGTSSCTQNSNGTESCTFNTYTIDKLTRLAKALNIDGWLLNIESGLAGDGIRHRERALQINRLIKHKFPKEGVEYVVYSQTTNGLRGTISDDNIIDFGKYPPSDHGLDNATGLSADFLAGKVVANSSKNYLLYLDEPFTRSTPQDPATPAYRLHAAQQTQCQYFNGVGGWPGLKQYALAKFPNGIGADKLVCGGNVSAPVPTRILKVSISNGTTVHLRSGVPGIADATCTNDNPNTALWGKACYFELPSTGNFSPTLTFSGVNFKMNPAVLDPKIGNKWTPGLYMSPLVGAKWWWIIRDAGNQFDQIAWRGLEYWVCKATDSSSRSCTFTFPSTSSNFNIDTGLYGRPPYFNFMIDARFPNFIYAAP